MKQLTKEQAIALYQSGEWKDWTDDEVVKVQLFQRLLSIPFDRFHQALEAVLGRGVWTHEFAYPELLIDEYQKERSAPTWDDILNLLPKDKVVVVV